MKMMAILQHGPRHKLTKLHNCGHKIPRRFTQADKSNNKARTLMIKLVMYSNISPAFNLFPYLSCSNFYRGCTLQICTSDPKCVTSHWQWWIGPRQTHEMAPGVNQEIELVFFFPFFGQSFSLPFFFFYPNKTILVTMNVSFKMLTGCLGCQPKKQDRQALRLQRTKATSPHLKRRQKYVVIIISDKAIRL